MQPATDIDQEVATAYHEAGHIVVAAYFGRIPEYVTIIPDDKGVMGKIEHDDSRFSHHENYLKICDEKKDYIKGRVAAKLTGSCAHDIFDPNRTQDAGDEYDIKCANRIIENCASWASECKQNYFNECKKFAINILNDHWNLVKLIANELLSHKELKKNQIEKLLEAKFV